MRFGSLLVTLLVACAGASHAAEQPFALAWKDNYLSVMSERIPGKLISILYIEAYCRPGSTNRKWEQTVIGHKTRLIESSPHQVVLECTLNDGVIVRHEIAAGMDEVNFTLTAINPTKTPSQAHWAQPCVRVGAFTGRNQQTYLDKSFVFLNEKPARMPTPNWATQAVYTPGQVWCPRHVNRDDVNPRPLSPLVPDNGLIGCYSADEKMILALAFEPYQELFQGVITCLHSDFRIGGLEPGQSKAIRGKMYVVPADVDALLARYRKDFPEHVRGSTPGGK